MSRSVEGGSEASGRPDFQEMGEAELARRFWDRLRLFAARRLGDVTVAEDVAQETLRRVVEAVRSERVQNPQALPAFVFQTARNICMHRHRSRRRESRAMVKLRRTGSSTSGADPLVDLVSAERRRAVRQALQQLDEADRELLRMFYYEETETAEVARRLEVTAGAVRVRKHRALKRLSRLLSEEAG